MGERVSDKTFATVNEGLRRVEGELSGIWADFDALANEEGVGKNVITFSPGQARQLRMTLSRVGSRATDINHALAELSP